MRAALFPLVASCCRGSYSSHSFFRRRTFQFGFLKSTPRPYPISCTSREVRLLPRTLRIIDRAFVKGPVFIHALDIGLLLHLVEVGKPASHPSSKQFLSFPSYIPPLLRHFFESMIPFLKRVKQTGSTYLLSVSPPSPHFLHLLIIGRLFI